MHDTVPPPWRWVERTAHWLHFKFPSKSSSSFWRQPKLPQRRMQCTVEPQEGHGVKYYRWQEENKTYFCVILQNFCINSQRSCVVLHYFKHKHWCTFGSLVPLGNRNGSKIKCGIFFLYYYRLRVFWHIILYFYVKCTFLSSLLLMA